MKKIFALFLLCTFIVNAVPTNVSAAVESDEMLYAIPVNVASESGISVVSESGPFGSLPPRPEDFEKADEHSGLEESASTP